jgi:pimeloyl-ACP methyl ester carboxylesterase
MTLLVIALLAQDPVEAVRKYLETGDEAALKAAGGEIEAVERAVRAAMARPAAARAGVEEREIVSTVDPGVKIAYRLAVPEAATKGGARPLLVSLHGQGGTAEEWLKGRLAEIGEGRDFYVLAPQAGSAGWGHSRLGYEHVLGPMRDAMARHPIDADRVWLEGGSMGANGTWQIGSLFADRFAALAPRGGCPHFVKIKGQDGQPDELRMLYARNLKLLPVSWTYGAKDKGLPVESARGLASMLKTWRYDLSVKELSEGGHEWFAEESPRILEWMVGKARAADPAEVFLVAWERLFLRLYWVEILEVTAKESVKTPVKDFDGKVLETRTVFSSEVRADARANRKQNSIDVKCDGVKELRLWLNDRLLDLSKPVIIRVNGKKAFEGRVERSVRTLLEEARRRGDASMLYSAFVTLKP